MTLALEEKYDQVRQLIAMGKERGYLLYDEVNDILPAEVHSSEEIDDLLSTFERYGIDVYEDLPAPRLRWPPRMPPTAAETVKEDAPASPPKTANSISLPERWKRRTIPFACTCARWAPFRC